MATVTITLPKAHLEFLEAQAAARGFKSVSTYLDALIRAERRRKAEEELVRLVQEAEASGPATEWTKEDRERIWHRAMQRLAGQRANHAKNPKKARGRR